LYGKSDYWGWAHLISLPISILISHLYFGSQPLLTYSLFILSFLIALLEALVTGLTPDEKWDARHNPDSVENKRIIMATGTDTGPDRRNRRHHTDRCHCPRI
jgi:hypothetical protein